MPPCLRNRVNGTLRPNTRQLLCGRHSGLSTGVSGFRSDARSLNESGSPGFAGLVRQPAYLPSVPRRFDDRLVSFGRCRAAPFAGDDARLPRRAPAAQGNALPGRPGPPSMRSWRSCATPATLATATDCADWIGVLALAHPVAGDLRCVHSGRDPAYAAAAAPPSRAVGSARFPSLRSLPDVLGACCEMLCT